MNEHAERTVTLGASMDAWLATPTGVPCGAVVLCPDIFGLTQRMKGLARDLAGAGHVALAINLNHRVARGLSLPVSEEGRARGLSLFSSLTRETVLDDVALAIQSVREGPGGPLDVALLGVSSGGHVAYLAGCSLDTRLVIALYAGWLTTTDVPLSRPEPTVCETPKMATRGVRVLYLVGEDDLLVTPRHRLDLERALRGAGVRHEIVVYPGAGHAFFFEEMGGYHPAAREDAWKRTLRALRRGAHARAFARSAMSARLWSLREPRSLASFCVVVLALLPLAACDARVHAPPSRLMVVSASDLKFHDVLRADGARVGIESADLWGDAARTAHGTLSKVPAGLVEPMHTHSRDFRVFVIDGAMRYTFSNDETGELTRGSYVQIPAGLPHQGRCVASAGCVVLVEQDGAMDMTLTTKGTSP